MTPSLVRNVEYSPVTELPGQLASRSQLEMMHTRYAWAASYCKDQAVVEAACGPGVALPHLARIADRLEAGDVDPLNLEYARAVTDGIPNVRVRRFDALSLPLDKGSQDVAILFEALYYLEDTRQFFKEAKRVLRPGGVLLMSMPNPNWPGFLASPLSTQYWSERELRTALAREGFQVATRWGFPETASALRRLAVAAGVVPRTMNARAIVKTVFSDYTAPIPARLDLLDCRVPHFEDAPVDPTKYRILYVEATRQ